MNYKLSQKLPRNGSLSHASVSAPPPQGSLGTGSWSKQASTHPYASVPPSKRGTKIKRNTSDQFCTRKSCSEPKPYTVQTDKLESGHTSTKAPVKYIGTYYRKSQPKNGNFCDLGQYKGNPNHLTESRAAEALARLEASKAEKEARAAWKREQDARELANTRKAEAKALKANSLENAFKR